MTRKKSDAVVAAPIVPPIVEEDWKIVQVASHMGGLSYQTARNQMLQGVFGESKYDAKTRCLTVSSTMVRKVKAKQDKAKLSKRRKNRPRPSVAKGVAGARKRAPTPE